MGPWTHGQWIAEKGDSLKDFYFGSNTSDYFRNEILTPFFKHYLKNESALELQNSYMFDTGNNTWKSFNNWPPKEIYEMEVYLNEKGRLSFVYESNSEDFTEYISDPENPVPYTDQFVDSRTMYYRPYMNEDQRFTFTRPDVIAFQTEPMDDDITFAGAITAELFVSTTGTDADWIVKIIDVYPYDFENPEPNPARVELGGYQRLLRYEIMRGKFRNSYEIPEPFTPNMVTKVNLKLNDIYHTVKKGHRIMIQIQSSMFPFFDRNPQSFSDIYLADEKNFIKATHKVFHSKDHSSKIIFKVLK